MEFGVEMDGTQDFFQMFWPVVVSHKIDEKSPLYSMSARDIAEHTFEIILTMEGITPETGNTVQVTSHQPLCCYTVNTRLDFLEILCSKSGHQCIEMLVFGQAINTRHFLEPNNFLFILQK